MNRALEYWRARSRREQQILGLGGLLIVAVLLVLYVIAPLNKERTRVRAALPGLRLEAAAFDAAALEVNRLKPLVGASAQIGDMQSTLRDSAVAMQIDAGALAIAQGAPGRARVTLERVPFDRFARWIDALQRNHKLRLNSALIRALPETGMVAVEAELTAPAAAS